MAAGFPELPQCCWHRREKPTGLLAHIFPTVSAHIGFLGDYSFRDDPSLATLVTKINSLPLSEPSPDQLNLDFS